MAYIYYISVLVLDTISPKNELATIHLLYASTPLLNTYSHVVQSIERGALQSAPEHEKKSDCEFGISVPVCYLLLHKTFLQRQLK